MSFVKSLIQKDENISLEKFKGEFRFFPETDLFSGQGRQVCFVDVETTGKNRKEDGIVELAAKTVSINEKTGEIISIVDQYESFHDPGFPISEEASAINGISDEMVEGHAINWERIESIFNSSELIVSHNASFDRSFLDRELPLSAQKLWGCSVNDVEWFSRGFTNLKQELLCVWHGFYYDSHRAMNDVDALIYLLTHSLYPENKPIVELMENAAIPYYKISALNSPFETKDKLKARNYRWNSEHKCWWKKISSDQINSEKSWLTEEVYSGYFRGSVDEVSLVDKYKD